MPMTWDFILRFSSLKIFAYTLFFVLGSLCLYFFHRNRHPLGTHSTLHPNTSLYPISMPGHVAYSSTIASTYHSQNPDGTDRRSCLGKHLQVRLPSDLQS